jgi:hypothetical protein
MFRPTACVWSHSDLAKYTAAEISEQHKNVGVAVSFPPAPPLPLPLGGTAWIRSDLAPSTSLHMQHPKNSSGQLWGTCGNMYPHTHAHMCTHEAFWGYTCAEVWALHSGLAQPLTLWCLLTLLSSEP